MSCIIKTMVALQILSKMCILIAYFSVQITTNVLVLLKNDQFSTYVVTRLDNIESYTRGAMLSR